MMVSYMLWSDSTSSFRTPLRKSFADLAWWLDFAFIKLGNVRLSTRRLVRILDLRNFAKDCYQFATDQNARFLHSLHLALKLLPEVNALLLDSHTEIDPNSLVSLTENHSSPLLLSISRCSTQLPGTFFTSPSLQKLVYLDVSNLPGSVVPLIQQRLLPHLRILKLGGREIDDATLIGLVQSYRLRLWSLDVSHNRLTDGSVQPLVESCFPITSLRSPIHFQVEGRLSTAEHGTISNGPFVFIDETQSSASFSNPERYQLDAPTYNAQPYMLNNQRQVFRSDGRSSIRSDSADGASLALSHQSTYYDVEDTYRNSRGITHLDLSYNQISASGIERLIRTSNGQIESFACDSMPLVPLRSPTLEFWPDSASLHGIIGMAHMFRPVYSPNLQSLRIHHSLVTNIPCLSADGLSSLTRLYLAETSIRARVDQAYPQRFMPDMNPRLSSLTLTCIPRRSSGPLTERLLNFLKLLSIQERAIEDVRRSTQVSWRWSGMLRGLRHLRLEFEPDTLGDGASTSEDVDPEQLMNSGERGFSFFEQESRHFTRSMPDTKSRNARYPSADAGNTRITSEGQGGGVQKSARDNVEAITYHDEWNGCGYAVQVWAGPAQPHANPIVNEYRRLVLNHDSLREDVGPVSPSQVIAGAPDRSYIFHAAWRATLMPPDQLTVPAPADVTGMQDVLELLKKQRAAGRVKYTDLQNKRTDATLRVPLGAPHFFWTGSLEVST